MKVLMLCGVFAEENEEEIIANSTAPVEFSANIFQKKLIDGFMKTCESFRVLSAPFIGTYPTASKIVKFSGFLNEQDSYEYVDFNNIWGYRNISRARSMKNAVKSFAEEENEDKLIVVYSAHTPFIEAAAYAKTIDPEIKICVIVPDLPNYMRLDGNRNLIYDAAKKLDIKKMYKLMDRADSFVLLTEQMKELLPVGNKPYMVVEGIVDSRMLEKKPDTVCGNERNIVYTGKLSEKFGIRHLVEEFKKIEDDNCRLVLCGCGDCDEYVKQQSLQDGRIIQMGQITPTEVAEQQKCASVLVNPRPNNEEYTKYSFPSKNIEYLLTGKPVVAYMLDGMPEIYRSFIYPVSEKSDIAQTLIEAMNSTDCGRRHSDFIEYAAEQLSAEKVCEKILMMTR